MSKFAQIFTIILIFGVFFAFPATAQGNRVTKADLQNMYMQALRALGYPPDEEPDADGDIRFMFSGRHYYIILNKDDPVIIDENNPLFFRIYREVSLGSFSREAALSAANNLNMLSMVAKFYIPEGRRNVAINTELLVPNQQDFKTVLTRALNLMRFAEDNFFLELGRTSSVQ